MSARQTALDALIACRKTGAWSNGVLKELLQRNPMDRREAALTSRLCYGVLQNRDLLDHYLAQLLTGKLKDLHPLVRDILHLGIYQLICMDRIPESAAVNESVALAKRYCKKQQYAPGLVNAVLRKAARDQEKLLPPQTLQQKYSHPADLIRLLESYVGSQRLEPMLQANNDTPKTVVQVNTLKITAAALLQRLEAEGIEAHPHAWMPDCLVLSSTGDMEKLPSFCEGLFYVQDPAAKLSVLCARLPAEPMQVLDCCAAPGGKSFAAAIAMEGKGTIVSCDIHAHKIPLIENGAARLGIQNLSAKQQDASCFCPEWEGKMDAVIADVPCSGYGIIRKKPDIRFKSPDDMKELPQLQLAILENQSRYVKPGGVLMYSTCTLVRRENEGVVEKFLKKHPEFYLQELSLPDVFPKNTSGMLALVPGEYDTDGFFIARLRRNV